MKKILFIIILISIAIKGQTNLDIVYEYIGTPDSTNLENKIKAENFVLSIDSLQNTVYRSINKYKLDSVIANNSNDFILGYQKASAIPYPSTNRKIFKLKNNENYIIENEIYGIKYTYSRNKNKNNWVLGHKSKQIQNYKVYNAFIELSGRKYEAWYTNEIPISSGPYLFSGLPGLILEIYDLRKDYYFNMVAINNGKLKFDKFAKDSKKVTIQEFSKITKNYNNNPIIEMEANGAIINEENKRKILERVKERKKESNNPIELKPEY